MTDPVSTPAPGIVGQTENVASMVEAEVARVNAARSAAFHSLVSEFGIRAVYMAIGAMAVEVAHVLFLHAF